MSEASSKPKLRFPQFHDAGEWEEKWLGELSEIVRGGSPRPIDDFLTADEQGLNWLKIGDVDKSSKFVTHTQERVRIEALNKTREVHPGDLILSNSMSFGRPYILKIKSCIHDGWIAITEIDDHVDRDYLYYLISSPSSQAFFINNAAGSGVQNLNADIIKTLPTLVPKPPEQQKIADCLTSIDDLITAEAEKLTALKDHKKGLMQQLFPRKGETKPRIRFPEFSGEWCKDELGKHIELQSGYAFKSEYFAEKGRKLVTPKNFTKSGFANFHTKNSKFTIEDFDPKYSCRDGDLLLLLTDLTPSCELLGKPLLLTKSDGEVLLNQRIVKVTPKNRVEKKFLHYFFSTEIYHSKIKATATGSTVRHSSNKVISSMELLFPSKEEQIKISECLSSLDEFITAEAQKLDALKDHKQGLMQQLFPTSDEVNG
ncbi:MAG: restriction endonuclease subunit S [Sulfitobacter sp.]